MTLIERMRAEWNARAKQDAHFYVAFAGQNQNEAAFQASAAENLPALEQEFVRLPQADLRHRRALEIGCGPGRLLAPMSKHFGEIHGVDISEEMIALGRSRLAHLPGVHLHQNSGQDLQPLQDNYFDLVYSYIVFQHIPDRATVLNYLREAHRVLKPGGVLRCQLRGTPPIPSEMQRESETWTGCHFSAADIAAFGRDEAFPLLELSGLDTQYMWTTFQKKPADATRDPLGAILKAVTSAGGEGNRVPHRGPAAAISLWIDAFPGDGDLARFPVWFGDTPQLGCYLSPISESGGCQLNARLPQGLAQGSIPVRLGFEDRPLEPAFEIIVEPAPPLQPRVVKVTDGINLTAHARVETGGLKVVLEEIEDPSQVRFLVEGRAPQHLNYECKDTITGAYEFAFHLPHRTRKGKRTVSIEIGEKALTGIEIDVISTRD